VGAGTKIDNMVQIGHNVRIGRACLLAGEVGLSGSVVLGDGVVLAGKVGVVDHVNIGSGTLVGATSLVVEDAPAGCRLWGNPAQELSAEKRSVIWYRRLPVLAEELKELKKKVKQIEDAKNNPA